MNAVFALYRPALLDIVCAVVLYKLCALCLILAINLHQVKWKL